VPVEVGGITPTSVTTAVISFGGVRSYNGFGISRLGMFSVASDSRGIEIGNVENISFDGPAGTADELLVRGDSVKCIVNRCTELIFRETVQRHHLRDFVRLATNDDWY